MQAQTNLLTMDTRTAWLQARRDGIGGSDIGAIMAPRSAFASPLSVYADKAGLTPLEGDAPSQRMRLGILTEEANLKLFAEETGAELLSLEEVAELVNEAGSDWPCSVRYKDAERLILGSHEYPDLLATLDGLARMPDGTLVVVEAKSHGAGARSRYRDSPRGVPDPYFWQVQTYLAVTGLQTAVMTVLDGGVEHFLVIIERDEEAIEKLAEAAEDMVRRVADGDPPDPVGERADGEAISKMHPEPTDESVELGDDADMLDLEYQDASAQLKEAKRRLDAAKQAIQLRIGDAKRGHLPSGVSYTWGAQTRNPSLSLDPDGWDSVVGAIDLDALGPKLRDKLEEVANKGTSSFRVLRRSKAKVAK